MRILSIMFLVAFTSCSTIRTAERNAIRNSDKDLYNLVDDYYETINGKENNYSGEQDSIMQIIKKRAK